MATSLTKNNSTAIAPLNALQHGLLSRQLVLPWEDKGEYAEVLEGVTLEHQPQTATEGHLVEELAGILWRKRRLRIAEAAHYQRELGGRSGENYTAAMALACIETQSNPRKFSYRKALSSSVEENSEELKAIAAYREPALQVRQMLEDGASYEVALAALENTTQEWWQDVLRGEGVESWERYTPDTSSLAAFLDKKVLPYYAGQHEEVIFRPLIKQQAEGEAYMPSKKLETFTRYEVHLDRKFERTLTVLLRLQEMRMNRPAATSPEKIA